LTRKATKSNSMPIEVEVEGLGVLEFPDGTSKDVISATVKRKVGGAQDQFPSGVSTDIAPRQIAAPISTEPGGVFDAILGQLGSLGGPSIVPPMPSPESQPAEFQAYQRGLTQTAATGTRMGGIAAAMYSGGATLPLVLGGAGGEVAGQAIEMAGGEREAVEPGRVAGAAVRSAIPISRVGGPITSAAYNLAAQTGAGLTAKALEEGRALTLREAAMEAAFAAPAGVAGAFAGTRGSASDPLMAKAQAARRRIETMTGEKLPEFVGETANDLAVLRGEFRAEDFTGSRTAAPAQQARDNAKKVVLIAAANAANRGELTADGISKEAISALEQHVGPINQQATDSINQLANDVVDGRLGTLDDIRKQAAAAIPGPSGLSRLGVFESIKKSADDALGSARAQWDILYNKVRSNPLFSDETLIDTAKTKAWANNKLGAVVQSERATETGLVDEFGRAIAGEPTRRPIPSALPSGTQKWVATVKEAADTQSLEQIRNLRTELGYGIADDNYLPGLGQRAKQELYSALTDDINQSLKKIEEGMPVGEMRKLASDLRDANDAYSSRVDDFKTVFASGLLKEEGARGAFTAEGAMGKLTGSQAYSNIQSLRRLLGANAEPEVQKIYSVMRDDIVANATKNLGMAEEQLSVGKVLEQISDRRNMPEELARELFPNADKLRKIASRELQAAKLKGSMSEVKALLSFDPIEQREAQTILEAMSQPWSEKVRASAQEAIKAKATESAALQNTMIQLIRGKNGEELVRSLDDLPKVAIGDTVSVDDLRSAVGLINSSSPDAAQKFKRQFVEKILDMASEGNVVNVEKLQNMLRRPVEGQQVGNVLFSKAEAVLGKDAAKNLVEVTDLLRQAERPVEVARETLSKAPTRVKDMVIGGLVGAALPAMTGASATGIAISAGLGVAGGTVARGVQRLSDKVRYKLASALIADTRFSRVMQTAYTQDNFRRALRLGLNALEIDAENDQERAEIEEAQRTLAQ
jgi:hypothetical protein